MPAIIVSSSLESRISSRSADTKIDPSRRTSARPSLVSLPDDILLLVINHLDVKSILQMRQTCWKLFYMTKLRWVWSNVMKQHIVGKGLPIPACLLDVRSLPSQHLESRAVHAAKFQDNWNSSCPSPRRTIAFYSTNANKQANPVVRQVLFLPGRNGELIVSTTGNSIICWEVPLGGSAAYLVAEWVAEADIEQMIVNEDSQGHAHVAILYASNVPQGNIVSIATLELDTFHGRFIPRALLRGTRDTTSPMHSMRRDTVVFGDPLVLWTYTERPDALDAVRRVLRHPDNFDDSKVLCVKLVGEYLLIVRRHSIELLNQPQCHKHPKGQFRGTTIISHPALEAVVVPNPPLTPWNKPVGPLSIILRCCDDGFDTIRRYDLPTSPTSTQRSGPVNDEGELPWILPTSYTNVMTVAPSSHHFRAGSRGKGIWIQTNNVTSRRSVYPARCIIGFDIMEGGETRRKMEDLQKSTTQLGNDLHVCERSLYSRRCDPGEVVRKKYCLHSADIEDIVGRVVVGDRQGNIEVLDYA